MAMYMKVLLVSWYYGHAHEGDSCMMTILMKVNVVYYDHINKGKLCYVLCNEPWRCSVY